MQQVVYQYLEELLILDDEELWPWLVLAVNYVHVKAALLKMDKTRLSYLIQVLSFCAHTLIMFI